MDAATPIEPPSYTWPIVIIVLAAGVLVLGILYLRPAIDPLAVLGGVGTLATLVSGLALNFIKAHEALLQTRQTAKAVDGITHELMDARDAGAQARGEIQGAAGEQARVAEQKAIAATTGDRRVPIANTEPAATDAAPVAVKIVSPAPIPVVQVDQVPKV